MRLINADKAKEVWGTGDNVYNKTELGAVIRMIFDACPDVDVVPLSDLLTLRDWLYEHDAITMEGLSQLNQLISRYKKECAHE